MGKRGPLKLPAHLRVVAAPSAGSDTVADSLKPVPPERPVGFPEDDADLSVLWDELVALLDEAGLVARCDGMTLELTLRHFLVARRASDEVLRGDVVVDDPAHGGVKKNPAEAVFRGESLLFLEYAKQLGLSFASRARVVDGAKGLSGGGAPNPFAASGS